MNNWKKIVALVVILLLIGGYVVKKRVSSQKKLVFANPQRRAIRKTIDVSGLVDAKERVRLRFLTGGKLTYLGAKEGDQIKKWQTIATIDQATLKKQLEQDLNNYLSERWNFEQTRDDYVENGDGIPQPIPDLRTRRMVDQSQFNLNNKVLNVEIRDIAIKNTRLVSPINGILTTAPTAVAGMQLLATDYFEIVNPKTFVFKATVDEADIKDVQIGQNAELELDAFPGEIINAKISYVAFASSQSSSGTVFVVEAPLDQSAINHTIRLGMNGDLSIILAKKDNALTIPIEATKERDGLTFVDVKTGEKNYQEKQIETGIEGEDYVEVVSGLSESDLVLIPE